MDIGSSTSASSSCRSADVVDLEPELDREPLPLRLDNRVDVVVEVVDAALGLVRERPQRPGLTEVVDVLGEADLVDHPARRAVSTKRSIASTVCTIRSSGSRRCMW